MIKRIVILVAAIVFLRCPSIALAQLTPDEYKQFIQLLNSPESKETRDKRFKFIADAVEREADPKRRVPNTYPVDLKFARIPAAEGLPYLQERLGLSDDVSKRTILRMLGGYGVEAKPAAPAVLDMLKENRGLRADIITALGRLDTTNAKIAEAILEQLGAEDSSDAITRAALPALIAMSSVVPKSAAPRLAKFLEHRQGDVGAQAHELIGKIHALERPDLEKLRDAESIDWRESPDQGYAVFASIAAFGPKADFAAPLVVGVLDSKPPTYMELVVMDTLFKMRTGHPKAIAAILARLTSKDPYLRSKAYAALNYVDLKQPESVRALAAGLKHDDRNARIQVVNVLRNSDDPKRMPPEAHAELLAPLIDAINGMDESAFSFELEMYLTLLRRFGKRAAPAADKLAKLYESELFLKKLGPAGPSTRGKILATLANIGVPESTRPLVMQVLEKGPVNQPDGGYSYAAAARAAASFAEPKDVVPLLIPGLQIKVPEISLNFNDWSDVGPGKPTTVRLEVLRALAKLGKGASDALPQIKELAENNADATEAGLSVRVEAQRAYQAIAGEALPPLKGIFADGKKDLLHFDERLAVKMPFKVRNPRPQDVLKRLQDATKLKFTMDENIDPDTPVWGSMYTSGTNAVTCMRQLASSVNIQGAWVDVGDGYRLVATAKTPDRKSKAAKFPVPPFRDDSFDPMPDDPRLQKILTLQIAEPTVPELLKIISDNTGVNFTLEKIDTETPVFGSVNWSKTTAWLVLRNIAESQRVQGNWEKVGDAYHLRGSFIPAAIPIAKAPAPTAKAPSPVANAPEVGETPPKPRTSLYIALGILSAIFLSAAFLLTLRLLLFRNHDASTT